MTRTARLLLLFGLLPFAACSSTYTLVFEGDRAMNPNTAGEPCSATIRAYQLRNPDAFNSGNPDQLWADPKAVLGDALIGSQKEIIVRQGTRNDSSRKAGADNNALVFTEVPAEVTCIGLLTGFHLDPGFHRVVVPKGEVNGAVVLVTARGIEQQSKSGAAKKAAEGPKSGDS